MSVSRVDIFLMMKLRYSEFKDRIDLDEFENAIGFVPTSQSRDEDTGQCPDVWGLHKHGDTTGKFSINREKRVYNCWVCNGGSLLDLAIAVTGKDPTEATEWLYEFAIEKEEQGNELEDQIHSILSPLNVAASPSALPYFNEKVLTRFDDTYYPWYAERGITRETQEAYRIRISREHQRKSKTGEVYHGPAVILPHFWEHKLVGWQERWLDPDRPKWIPKYTNTPDFPREETVFNYDRCIKQSERPIICESVFTVLRVTSVGIPAIATFGSNVSDVQLSHLQSFQSGVVLSADNDGPGIKWRKRLTEFLDSYVPVYWTNLVPNPSPDIAPHMGTDLGDLEYDDEILQYYENAYLHWVSDT